MHIKMRTVVRHDPKGSQFVAYVDGNAAGHSHYQLHGNHVWVLSTVMDPHFTEPGVEDLLIEGLLQEVHRRRLALLPYCLRTRAYLSKHHRYLALVPPAERGKFRHLAQDAPTHPLNR